MARQENRVPPTAGHQGSLGVNPAMYMAQGQVQYCLPNAAYAPLQKGQMSKKHIFPSTGTHGYSEDMTAAFSTLNVNGYPGSIAGAGTNNMYYVPSMSTMPSGPVQYRTRDGRIFTSQMGNSQANYQQAGDTFPVQQQYVPQGITYQAGHGTQVMGWNGTHQVSRETTVPELAAPRRNSLSSNEENGPHTPFFGASVRADFQPKVSISDSPHAWTTPSPQQLGQPFYPDQLIKGRDGRYVSCDLDSICIQEPSIPKPVPAIFSGEKGRGTLEKSLQNNLNTTNVYIRGLHPNTTDEMLKSYGIRFGDIISAKSMLEQDTGNCKGFGFIKYHNFVDGENCIRAFFHWGYEAKWARVSHNEKLKTLGDEGNTNLYVSNLPLDFNEHTLMATFHDYEVLSAKILRDSNGLSRGVGFARFATPEICKQIIEQYNGKRIGDDGSTLSIRFADTPKQKELKTVTAERRQYKANEYNVAVYSPGSPYLGSPMTAPYQSPLQGRSLPSTYWPSQAAQLASLYPGYPVSTAAYPSSVAVSNATAFKTVGTENTAPASRQSDRTRIEIPESKLESPSAAALAKRTSMANIQTNIQSPVKSEGDISSTGKCYGSAAQTDAKSSPIKPTKYSPAKSTPSKANNLLRI